MWGSPNKFYLYGKEYKEFSQNLFEYKHTHTYEHSYVHKTCAYTQTHTHSYVYRTCAHTDTHT